MTVLPCMTSEIAMELICSILSPENELTKLHMLQSKESHELLEEIVLLDITCLTVTDVDVEVLSLCLPFPRSSSSSLAFFKNEHVLHLGSLHSAGFRLDPSEGLFSPSLPLM